MRATSIFILLVMLFGIYHFGYLTLNELKGSTAPDPLGNNTPFTTWLDYNATNGTAGSTYNDTVVGSFLTWVGGTSMAVLDVTGMSNFAVLMLDFLNALSGFVTAPFALVEVLGINEVPMMMLIPVVLLVLFILALWQIITGRTV